MEYIYESPDNGKTVYRRPVEKLGPKELVSANEVSVMSVQIGNTIHLSAARTEHREHKVRPATEVDCPHCRIILEFEGIL